MNAPRPLATSTPFATPMGAPEKLFVEKKALPLAKSYPTPPHSISSKANETMEDVLLALKNCHLVKRVAVGSGELPRFNIDITSVKIHLNRSYYIKALDKHVTYEFMVICKYKDQTYSTRSQKAQDMGTIRVNAVQFREAMHFENLPFEFDIQLEVFSSRTEKRESLFHRLITKAGKTLMCSGGARKRMSQSMGETLLDDITAGYRRCGTLHLNRHTIGARNFYLSDVGYPLEGTVEIR